MQGVSILFDTQNLLRLFEGLVVSTEISFISIFISIIGGLVFGVLMSMKNKFIYFILKICLEIVRIMPQIVWLFLFYFGVSKAFEVLAFWPIVGQRCAVDHEQLDGATDLWRRQPDSVGVIHRFKHVGNELLQVGIIAVNRLCFFSQYGLPVGINW